MRLTREEFINDNKGIRIFLLFVLIRSPPPSLLAGSVLIHAGLRKDTNSTLSRTRTPSSRPGKCWFVLICVREWSPVHRGSLAHSGCVSDNPFVLLIIMVNNNKNQMKKRQQRFSSSDAAALSSSQMFSLVCFDQRSCCTI